MYLYNHSSSDDKMIDVSVSKDLFLAKYTKVFDEQVSYILINIAKIVNRNLCFSFFNREEIIQEILDILKHNDCETKFRFNFKMHNKTFEKTNICEVLQKTNYISIVEYGIRIGISLVKVMIENYNFKEHFLMEATETIVENVLCFRSLNLFEMDGINKCLIDFTGFLLRKIGSVNFDTYTKDHGTFVCTIMEILLRYSRVPEISEAIFQEVSNYLLNFIRYLKEKKIHILRSIHIEILTIFLHILVQIGESIEKICKLESKYEKQLDSLRDYLPTLRSVFPGHLHAYFDRCVDMLNVH